MKSLNPNQETSKRNGVIGLGLIPDHGPSTVNVKVSHGLDQYEVFLPASSNFGYLKSFICQKVGVSPERHKLFLRGTGVEDDEDLLTAGITENSEVVLMKAKANEQESSDEVPGTSVISKGEEDVAEVRKVVDQLSQQISVFQALVDRGIKVDNKEIVYVTEMLMRQLLRLDGIEAEGEGRVQRKTEVRRVQSMVETLDILKSRNSNTFSNTRKSLSVSTQCESLNTGCENANASSFPMPASSKI